MLSAHLTCSFLMVGYVTATFVKERRVDTETLLRLRLHDCGKGVRRGSPIPPDPDFLRPRERGVTQSGWWKDCLLKHPELRQVGKYFHDVQDLPVLELVVLKAAGRPMPSPLALRLRD